MTMREGFYKQVKKGEGNSYIQYDATDSSNEGAEFNASISLGAEEGGGT